MYKKISYSDFIEEVVNNILDFMPEEFADADVEIREVTKVNKTMYELNIKKGNPRIVPTLYLESFYEEDKDLDDILMLIANTYVNALNSIPKEYMNNGIDDLVFNKDNIFFVLINTKRNKKLLSEIPHRDFYDLSIIYRSLVNSDNGHIASVIIRNEHLNSFGLTEEELFKIAYENTKKIFPPKIIGLSKMMAELVGPLFSVPEPEQEEKMYIVTNNIKCNGAIDFLYADDTLSKIAEEHNCNLYILPSSIHETIALLDNKDLDKNEIVDMVRGINVDKEVISEGDVLSDNVYYYDKEKKEISMIFTLTL